MIAPFPAKRPAGAVIASETSTNMKTILHIGAHRCATSTFQSYMRQNANRLRSRGIGFWGPERTRSGLFRGLQPAPELAPGRNLRRRGVGRVQLNCARRAENGVQTLIVSDENMIGSLRENVRTASVYAGAGERLARYAEAFEGHVTDVVMNIRSLEWYWASALGLTLARGRPAPDAALLSALADTPRGWRDVITDVACAMGDAKLHVLPFETYGGRPDAQFAVMTGQPGPAHYARAWHNATPRLPALREFASNLGPGEGRWQPFDLSQRASLNARYAEDMAWLRAGADGLARLVDDRMTRKGRLTPARTELTRGNEHDHTERRLARHRGI